MAFTFSTVATVVAGRPRSISVTASRKGTLFFHNFSAFAQDTWKAKPNLTLTYGLRWELNPAPSSTLPLLAVAGTDNLSTLTLAPAGTPLWKTTYGNFAPRVGLAYALGRTPGRETLLRGGLGLFYDVGTQQVGDAVARTSPPFGALQTTRTNLTFPASGALVQPPQISSALPLTGIVGFQPDLKLPYTIQWNIALEQALGSNQTISASYVGAAGRRLLQQEIAIVPNGNILSQAELVRNVGTSDYRALQVQFQRRLSNRFQALASYVWARSIDTASSGSSGSGGLASSDLFVRQLGASANRGPSDFDIRHAFSAAFTFDIPTLQTNQWSRAILGGWSVESVIFAHSAPPVDVFESSVFELFGEAADVRPDLVPGIPIYLFGSQYPRGRAINRAAFVDPPFDPNTGIGFRQGNLQRNGLRGFQTTQWDLGLHRAFHIHESVKLQFRLEMFNVLNHPNFANPVGDLGSPLFGLSTAMLGQSFGQGAGFGGLSALYQTGGPRSIQVGLKFQF